jgi:hypothetical protein
MANKVLIFPKSGTRRRAAAAAVDASGWTTFEQAVGDRQIYVSSSTGVDTGSYDATHGDVLHPFATIAYAKAFLRKGFADWMLLKCGDTWDEAIGNVQNLAGRSLSQRMLLGSYGIGARPLLRTGASGNILLDWNGTLTHSDYIAVVGLHLWAHTYSHIGFGPTGIRLLNPTIGWVIEDCRVDNFDDNISIQAYTGVGGSAETGKHANIALRRNVIVDAGDLTAGDSFGQGVYLENIDGGLIEENVVDFNGWNDTTVPGNVHAHNVYTQNGCLGLVFRGNTVANTDGVQLRSGGVCTDNLFLRTCIAITFGIGDQPDRDPSGVTGTVARNVALDGRDYNATDVRGWALSIGNVASATVEDNIWSNNVSGTGPRTIDTRLPDGGGTRGVHNTTFQRNIYYNWSPLVFETSAAETVNVQFLYEDVQNLSDSNFLIEHWLNNTSGVFAANCRFYSADLPSLWFDVAGIGSRTLAQWKALVGDTTSTATQASYVDPNRTIATYMTSIGGTASLDAFMAEARLQSRQNWRPQYTAAAVIAYIRAGFAPGP